jgi:ribulose-phosphate 3-epimerase
VRLITFHVEVDEPIAPVLQKIRRPGGPAGWRSGRQHRSMPSSPIASCLDIVLVMTVEPGFGGQSFMRAAAQKILPARDLLRHKPVGAEVHVDGGVNRESAEIVGGLGADVLVVGSALFAKGHDMGREVRLIKALADEGYQYQLNNGLPPIPRDNWVTIVRLPKALARQFMDEIEAGGIPVLMLRG